MILWRKRYDILKINVKLCIISETKENDLPFNMYE